MDDQTKPSNDLYGGNGNTDQSRPLTSFLQAQNAVKVFEETGQFGAKRGKSGQDDAVTAGLEPAVSDDEAGTSSRGSEAPLLDVPADPSAAAGHVVDERRDESAIPASIGSDEDAGKSEPEDAPKAETVTHDIDQNKLNTALKALKQIERQVATVIRLLETGGAAEAAGALRGEVAATEATMAGPKGEDLALLKPIDGRVVEGVFDGRGMVGGDGKSYMVPPNYASKSKLVEGDMLKLTITPKGSFIFKQIGPIERSRLIGSLGYDQTIGEYYATSENRRWNVIKASVTYFKGEPGDEVVLLVPKNTPSKWAAVENIIKRNPLG